ncbi:hypothetical protein PVA38_11730 [Streptococcus pneumoniae D39]|nr:hypothetical protein PVA38_11730 [Streptococcus pneumoniae D39]
MCIRDSYTYKVENPGVASVKNGILEPLKEGTTNVIVSKDGKEVKKIPLKILASVSYTHLRAHETVLDLVCRLLLEKKKNKLSDTNHHAPCNVKLFT